MTNEKFTPGEWRIEEHELSLLERGTVGFRIRTDSQIICAAYSSNLKDKPEMQANAALISAAPEMYRMLDTTKQMFENLADVLPNEQAKDLCHDMASDIIAVLEKARGEE